ncbi:MULTISPECIES: DNA-3-methyladenine glycosylase [Halobacterium]|uniref:DNA-3-methyladenine glycosylase family protein n=1 Tax=Halobacterium TaxID=2239 RepID=UPI0019661B54|nr:MULTISPECIES: DNA-3-methyladenine glycosylase [Halobacterium]MDL0122074.1 DNA-3-methyladenine glycosylase [Halobacterium salinarum]QRY25754.1 DNA-3-methyladenine glycosylase [Halobacterium sp. BOL4-2]
MERGAIPLDDVPGAVDVQATLESGQTYLWWRPDGDTYRTDGLSGGDAWYRTVIDDDVIDVRQTATAIEWRGTTDAAPIVRDALGLHDDLDAVRGAARSDPLITAAWDAYDGLRIVRDPFFGCLVSFICSAQMRVERIFEMQERLRREYGTPITFDGQTVYSVPEPSALAAATESDLRDLKLGYRAPYVQRTAAMVASGELTKRDIDGRAYELARETMTDFVGVGNKVADCVLLFSLGYLAAVPLDTWMQTAIEDHYPDCERGRYEDTSRAFREHLGPHAGYTQTYLFHYLRSGGSVPEPTE